MRRHVALALLAFPETFALAGLGVAVALRVAAAARPSVVALAFGCVASASCIRSFFNGAPAWHGPT